MESILDDIDEDLRKQLVGQSMRSMKLKELDHLLEGHEKDVLKAYNFWLLEGFVADSTPEADLARQPIRRSQLQSWCDRLHRNYGFGSKRIYDTLCDCTPIVTSTNAVNQLHLEQIKEGIHLLLFRPVGGKKKSKRQQAPDEDHKVPSSARSSEVHTVIFNDNEDYRKARMHSNKTSISGQQKPELIDISSSDSDPDVEILNSYQWQYRHPLHPSNGSPPSEGPTPGGRLFDRTEQKPHDLEQQSSPVQGRDPNSPSHTGITLHRANTHRKSTTKQLPHVVLTHTDSCMGHDSMDDDAVVRANKQMTNTKAKITSQQQEVEAAMEKQTYLRLNTYEKEVPNEKAEPGPLFNEYGTSRLQRSKRNQNPKPGKPHDEYLCYRCEVPGHFLQDCPTNLDPSFDRIPVGGYKCMICGKTKAHLTSLCPDNIDPNSLTQRRLRFDAVASRRLHGQDDYLSGYEKKDLKERRGGIFDSPNDVNMNEDRRRAILELDDDEDDQVVNQDSFESRYMRAKRAYALQQSPQDDQNIDYQILPKPKRVRRDDCKQGSNHRDSRVRDVPSYGKNSASSLNPSELLAYLDSPRPDLGRLSYWDNGEEHPPAPMKSSTFRYQGPALSPSPMRTKKQPSAHNFWPEDNRSEEIKCLFPHADPDWIDDMADFDIDNFFKEMEALALSTASDTLTIMSFMESAGK